MIHCFNPRTPVGCDVTPPNAPGPAAAFQSTHPCGVRLRPLTRCLLQHPRFQSTHPCGVRRSRAAIILRNLRFQSTHPCGVRRAVPFIQVDGLFRFQSTHPCGVRRGDSLERICTLRRFNPRTPVGCDVSRCHSALNLAVSIHAPLWGATQVSER